MMGEVGVRRYLPQTDENVSSDVGLNVHHPLVTPPSPCVALFKLGGTHDLEEYFAR